MAARPGIASPDATGGNIRRSGSGGPSWRRATAALGQPAFAWYWASQFVSGLGTWSQAVAQAWLVVELTRSQSQAATWLGTITMLQFLPLLLFATVGGLVADRVSRRRLLVVTQTAAAVQAATLGVLVITGTVALWQVAVLAFALGATNAFNNPAQQAFIPELVGRSLVADAVALNSVQFNSARMIGGAIGGVAVAAWGVSGAVLLNAASFVPAITVLSLIRPAHPIPPVSTRGGSVIAELRSGFSYVWATGPLRRVVLVFGVASLIGLNWQVVLPLVARFVLHRQVSGFGALMASFGAGSLLSAVVLAGNRRSGEHRLVAGGIALGAVLVLLGLSQWYPVTLLLVAAGGAASIVVSITANTRLQLLAPDRLRGRVMGIYVLLMGGTTPIGAFLLGQVSGQLGTETALIAFGTATALAVAAAGLHRRRPELEGPP